MQFEFQVGGKGETVTLDSRGENSSVKVGDEVFEVDCRRISDHSLSMLIGSSSVTAYIVQSGDDILVSIAGEVYSFSRKAGGSKHARDLALGLAGGGLLEISSPMPGKVVKVNVSEGDPVKKGESVAVVEAMKMENDLRCPADAVVKRVSAKAGDQVGAGQPIVELEVAGKEG